ncbi:MAG TPA: dinitrogenase iron-molybdenum cofactor biosynthesis protein [Cellvibrionaceae bacterium]|nr:dinitrogenase iron-molybdenum cofactor biosynthesis protein [Cellvibrionaceae bacterium]
MTAPHVSDEVALRIGLALRALADVELRAFVSVLIAVLGHPITLEKLARLRLSRLKAARQGPFAHCTDEQMRNALALLKGKGIEIAPDPLPVISDYCDGDMPHSIRVAVASDRGEKINGAFASCARFLIYQVSAREVRLIALRELAKAPPEEDKHSHRAQLINDCQVLYTTQIGGPAAAKVVRVGVHPMKIDAPIGARVLLRQLQAVLIQGAPPWLAKAMGGNPQGRVRVSQSQFG